MLRPFNPVDVLGLAVLQVRVSPNLAWDRRSMLSGARRSLPMGALLGEWVPGRNRRHTWLHSKRGIPLGVVSARRRNSNGTWEIDRVQIPGGQEGAGVVILEGLSLAMGRTGAERLFLRLAQGSLLEDAASRAGFRPLFSEYLYVRPRAQGPLSVSAAEGALRPEQEEDNFELFRLYNTAVPARVRQAESLSLKDWRGSRNICGGSPVEESWVVESDDGLTAVLTLGQGKGGKRMVDLLARNQDGGAVRALLERTVEAKGPQSSLVCLLPDYMSAASPDLEALGFHLQGSFDIYARPVVARVRKPRLLPVGA